MIIPDSVQEILSFAFSSCDNLNAIYYLGTEEDWSKITIESYNPIQSATIYIYSEEKSTLEGNYWHYGINGNPVVWGEDDLAETINEITLNTKNVKDYLTISLVNAKISGMTFPCFDVKTQGKNGCTYKNVSVEIRVYGSDQWYSIDKTVKIECDQYGNGIVDASGGYAEGTAFIDHLTYQIISVSGTIECK